MYKGRFKNDFKQSKNINKMSLNRWCWHVTQFSCNFIYIFTRGTVSQFFFNRCNYLRCPVDNLGLCKWIKFDIFFLVRNSDTWNVQSRNGQSLNWSPVKVDGRWTSLSIWLSQSFCDSQFQWQISSINRNIYINFW